MADDDLAVGQVEPEAQEQSEEERKIAALKESISVQREEIGSLRLKLTITVPQKTLDDRRSDEFAELKREAIIPGFRRGHAPLALVEKRFASDVGDQLKSQIISGAYLAATEKEELDVLGDPLFQVKVKEERIGDNNVSETVESERLVSFDKALDHIEFPREGDFVFVCEVELKPEFELPELKNIPVEKPTIKVTDENVDEEVQRLLMMRSTFEPVTDGSWKEDDMLYADMKMSVDGRVLAEEENTDIAARDMRIKGVPLEGFGKAAVNTKIGETITFSATVPDDHEDVDARGKQADFEFTVREIKRMVTPKLDKELLSSFGFEEEKELRDVIRGSLEARLENSVRRVMHENVGDYLVEKTDIEIPEGLSQRQVERSMARRGIEMLQSGVPAEEVKRRLDEMRGQAEDQVIRDLKLFFILEKIADELDVDVREEQLNAAIAEIARQSNKRFDRVRDELSKSDGLTTLFLQIRDEAVLDKLLEDADITEVEAPKKEKTAKKAAKKTAKKKTTKKK